MEKNLKITFQNCLLSFHHNSQLYPCRLSFFNDGILIIEKVYHTSIQTYPKKFITFSQNSLNFNLKLHINLHLTVSIRKINLPTFEVRAIEVTIVNNETKQTIKVYTSKTGQNYKKLYDSFRTRCFFAGFDHFFQICQIFKCSQFSHQKQYFVVKERFKSRNKMAKRFSKKNELSLSKIMAQISIQRRFRSQSIVGIQAIFQDNEYIYVVYNTTPNKSLKDLALQVREFESNHVKKILKQLLQAALELQIHNVVHNNIQPSTIQIIHEGSQYRVMLNHFGKAIYMGEWTVFMQQSIRYCYGYTAPEILNHKLGKLSSKSDVFSIGAVFYFMLLGKHLFRQNFDKPTQFVMDNYPEIDFETEQMKKLPAQSLKLLKNMLDYNPERRISVIEALTDRYFKKKKRQRKVTDYKQSISVRPNKLSTENKRTPMLRSQHSSISKNSIKENTNPLENNLHRSLYCPSNTPTFYFPKPTTIISSYPSGEIDLQDIDDSHINLEPRKLDWMAPSYEHKKAITFKCYTC